MRAKMHLLQQRSRTDQQSANIIAALRAMVVKHQDSSTIEERRVLSKLQDVGQRSQHGFSGDNETKWNKDRSIAI